MVVLRGNQRDRLRVSRPEDSRHCTGIAFFLVADDDFVTGCRFWAVLEQIWRALKALYIRRRVVPFLLLQLYVQEQRNPEAVL